VKTNRGKLYKKHSKNELSSLLEDYWPKDALISLYEVFNSEHIPPLIIQTKMEQKLGVQAVDQRKIYACYMACNDNDRFNVTLADKIYDYLSDEEAKVWKNLLTPMANDKLDK
jgi:hypothetical protein